MNKNPLLSATPAPGASFRNLNAASWRGLLAAIASLLIVPLSLSHAAQSCTLAWDASSDPNIAGYELRYGTSSGNPSQSIDVLKTTTFTVSNLNDATTYYFVVAAYNAAKVESQPSNEVSYRTPGSTPTPRDLPITIGETSILASPDSGNGNLLVAQRATLAQNATVESLSFYVTNASGKLRLGIFDATGPNGGPGTKKAETAEITPTVGWNKANVITPVSLPQGTYWLAYHASDNNLTFVKNLSGTARYYADSYGPLPATFSTSPTSEVVHWSLFATLTTSSLQGLTNELTVVNGSGSGSYPYGTSVPVSANAPKAGEQFNGWTGDVAILPIQDLNRTSTTALMPSMDVTITATYTAATTGMGLRGQYYNDGAGAAYPLANPFTSSPVLTRNDATMDFDWGENSPGPGVTPENFSVKWIGQVKAPVSGSYTFTVTADDGVRLFLSGAKVIDGWKDQSPTSYTYTTTLTTGTLYNIELHFYEHVAGAVCRLHWSYPGQPDQAIPQSQLSPGP